MQFRFNINNQPNFSIAIRQFTVKLFHIEYQFLICTAVALSCLIGRACNSVDMCQKHVILTLYKEEHHIGSYYYISLINELFEYLEL